MPNSTLPTLPMTVFVHLRALPSWLALDRAVRDRIAGEALGRALGDGKVTMRFFDAEAFAAQCSDVVMFEAADPRDWYFAFERLRDSPFFTVPYFEVVAIVPAYENGHQAFAAEAAQ